LAPELQIVISFPRQSRSKAMTISCFPRDEAQLSRIVLALKQAGLFNQYEEQAHGDKILLCVHTRTVEESERVRELLLEAGISQLIDRDAAA